LSNAGVLASFASRISGDFPLNARHPVQYPPSFPANLIHQVQILIRNIDRSLSEPEIKALFAKHGQVSSFDLVMDAKTGLSKGFGFVEMPDMDAASNAIRTLNGMKLGKSALRVKRAANSTVSKHQGKGRNG
jgi:RNA recognition motif-containing protein